MSISYREIFEITFIHLVFYSRNKKGWLFLASEAPSAPDERDDVTEKTEVIYGSENVVNRGIQGIPLAKETIDLCGEEAGPSTIVSISDSGQGIDPEAMCKLFEKFMSKSEKGTGLGLFISKSIVEAHGGKTWGENNKDGKGATFTFTLPLVT
jgi:signal transduction histidine kinase